MDALELTMKCSKLLKKPFSDQIEFSRAPVKFDDDRFSDVSAEPSKMSRSGTVLSEASVEAISADDRKNETTYIPGPPEEMGEVRTWLCSCRGMVALVIVALAWRCRTDGGGGGRESVADRAPSQASSTGHGSISSCLADVHT